MSTAPPTASGTDHHVRLRGLRFHFRDLGHPDGPVVVLLHGIMGHAREWDRLVEALAPAFRLVVLDQRGHGETDWAADYTATALADDLIALVEHLQPSFGPPPVHVIGHSMGGMAALVAAARRPDLVERLVVVDVGPDSVTADSGAALATWIQALGAASYATVDEAVAEWAAGNPLAREDLLRHYVRHCLVRRGDGALAWRFDAAGLSRFPVDGVSASELWDAVDGTTAPTLLVRGEHSPFLSRAAAERMVARLPSGRLVDIPAAGHDMGVEQPEAVAAAVIRFLAGE